MLIKPVRRLSLVLEDVLCSTEAAIHRFIHKIERALEAGHFALGVFVDIEGAFTILSLLQLMPPSLSKVFMAQLGVRLVGW